MTFGALAVGDKVLMERVKASTAEIKRCTTGLDPVPNFYDYAVGVWFGLSSPCHCPQYHAMVNHFEGDRRCGGLAPILRQDLHGKYEHALKRKRMVTVLLTVLTLTSGCGGYLWILGELARVDAYVKHLTAAANTGIQFMEATVSGVKAIKDFTKSDVGRAAIKGVTGVLHSVNPSHIMAVAANCAASPFLGVALETTNVALNAYQCYQLSRVISLVDNLPGQNQHQITQAEGNIIRAFRSELDTATQHITNSVIKAMRGTGSPVR